MELLKSYPIKNSSINLKIDNVEISESQSGNFEIYDIKYTLRFGDFYIDINFNEITNVKKLDYRIVISKTDSKDLSIDFDEWDHANQFIGIHEIISKGSITEHLLEREKAEKFHATVFNSQQTTYVTYGLILVNILIYFATVIYSGNWFDFDTKSLMDLGANYGPSTLNGEYWRYFTSIFLHGSLVHMAINMQSLYYLGTYVERLYGSKHFFVIYILSGLLGSAFSNLLDPTVVSVGASGAVFGTAAAFLVLLYKPSLNIPKSFSNDLLYSVGFFFVYNIFYGITKSGIDNGAHLGGAIGGLIFGFLMARPLPTAAKEIGNTHLVKTGIASFSIYLAVSFFAVNQAPIINDKKYSKALDDYLISQGYDSYSKGKYDDAFLYFGKAAERNSAKAQYFLALLHLERTKDSTVAFKWANAAAQNNSHEAMAMTGEMLLNGNGTEKDAHKAYDYFLKSDDQAFSNYYLGLMHINGIWVKKDASESMKWFIKGALKNNPASQAMVGYGYLKGIGIKQSNKDALDNFRMAAKSNNSYAQLNLGVMYGDGV